ncbi:hypothetical protein Hanom_Chr09g00793821 [Helianthus anomalus]
MVTALIREALLKPWNVERVDRRFAPSLQKVDCRFAPSLPGPNDPATYSPERTIIYTLSFSFCDVRHRLSPFKMALLQHYVIHFSQLRPLALLRIVQFELSYVVFVGEPSLPLFRRFYRLLSDGDWFTLEKRKDSVSLPRYSFMPTSTYPKEQKNMFIIVSSSMIPESLPIRDPTAAIDDGIPPFSAVKDVLSQKNV